MSRPKILVHPTHRFLRSVDLLAKELSEAAEEVILGLARAIDQLGTEGWGSSLPIHQVGGSVFRFDFHSEFSFEFRRETERDETKQPVCVHLYLLTLLRR